MKKTRCRKDGRYERLITLYDGITGEPIRKHIYAATTDELNKKAARLQAEYSGLRHSRFTVESYIEYYLNIKAENAKDTSTLDCYRTMFANHVKNTPFGRMRLDAVNIPACRQFLRDYRPLRNQPGTRIKQMLYGFLKMCFKQAWKEKLIKENPWDFVDKPRHTTQERQIITREQFELLLENIHSEQMERLMRFALNTGLRRGEICALRLTDIHLKEGYITVQNNIKKVAGKYISGTPKTKASLRNVPVPPSIIKLLKEQIATLDGKNKNNYLFPGNTGGHLDPDAVTRAFSRARDRAGLPKEITLHSLRATVATYLAELDFNPKKIQAKLGHSTPTMTMTRYIKRTPTMQDTMTAALENF